MKRVLIAAVAALATCAVAGSPALAATAKHTHHHAATCKQIKSAIDSGKSSADVQKELHVSAGRVKACTAPPAKKAAPSEKQS